jgi:hypothetical protein
LHLNRQEFACGPCGILSPTLSPRFAVADSLSLERRSAAIEYEDGLDAEEEELAYTAEEANNMTVPQGIALFITDSFEELVDPDGCVDGEALLV